MSHRVNAKAVRVGWLDDWLFGWFLQKNERGEEEKSCVWVKLSRKKKKRKMKE